MQVYDTLFRLILTVVIGGLIGYEREFNNRPAGFRTHILVCVGAAVISMIQLYSIEETIKLIQQYPTLENALKVDIGRLGAQVVTGVGFLGAGTIMRDKGSVKGLTTAASIWSVACIGLAIGLGYYTLSIMSAVCVFLVLVILKKFEKRFIEKTKIIKLSVQHHNEIDSIQKIAQYLKQQNIKVNNIEFDTEDKADDGESPSIIYTLVAPKEVTEFNLVNELYCFENRIKSKII